MNIEAASGMVNTCGDACIVDALEDNTWKDIHDINYVLVWIVILFSGLSCNDTNVCFSHLGLNEYELTKKTYLYY